MNLIDNKLQDEINQLIQNNIDILYCNKRGNKYNELYYIINFFENNLNIELEQNIQLSKYPLQLLETNHLLANFLHKSVLSKSSIKTDQLLRMQIIRYYIDAFNIAILRLFSKNDTEKFITYTIHYFHIIKSVLVKNIDLFRSSLINGFNNLLNTSKKGYLHQLAFINRRINPKLEINSNKLFSILIEKQNWNDCSLLNPILEDLSLTDKQINMIREHVDTTMAKVALQNMSNKWCNKK